MLLLNVVDLINVQLAFRLGFSRRGLWRIFLTFHGNGHLNLVLKISEGLKGGVVQIHFRLTNVAQKVCEFCGDGSHAHGPRFALQEVR